MFSYLFYFPTYRSPKPYNFPTFPPDVPMSCFLLLTSPTYCRCLKEHFRNPHRGPSPSAHLQLVVALREELPNDLTIPQVPWSCLYNGFIGNTSTWIWPLKKTGNQCNSHIQIDADIHVSWSYFHLTYILDIRKSNIG